MSSISFECDDDFIYDSWERLSDDDRRRIADAAIVECGPRWHPEEWGTHWAELVKGKLWTQPQEVS